MGNSSSNSGHVDWYYGFNRMGEKERKVERKRWRVWERESGIYVCFPGFSYRVETEAGFHLCFSISVSFFFVSFQRLLSVFVTIYKCCQPYSTFRPSFWPGRGGPAALKPSCIFKCYVAFGGTWPRSFLLPDTAEQRNVSMRLPPHTHTHKCADGIID